MGGHSSEATTVVSLVHRPDESRVLPQRKLFVEPTLDRLGVKENAYFYSNNNFKNNSCHEGLYSVVHGKTLSKHMTFHTDFDNVTDLDVDYFTFNNIIR